ncbi:uncharacterized protein LOC125620186 [Marmota marmota marmota]|uniref:uncharacterized protein LOC125620186 n=1 Tax=Marmota marmota marmota TaxID=9994 RepID=UPI002092DD0F|nr:uncharacterized protein LOC125620186 [Marmota marmota marmota]
MLGHQFYWGDGGARLSLPSAINSCVANTDPGKQWMLFPGQEGKGIYLKLDTCNEVKNPPKLDVDALGGSAVKTPGCELHVLIDTMTQKIIKRKQLFRKWRMTCRFPGLQASENYENRDENDQNSLNSSSLNGDLQEEKENDLLLDKKSFLPSGHPDSKFDSQKLVKSSVFPSDEPKVSSAADEAKHVLNDATGVCKQKIITRKVLMSKRKLACRFPGLQASGMLALGCT